MAAIQDALRTLGQRAVNTPVLPFADKSTLKNLFASPGSLYGGFKQAQQQPDQRQAQIELALKSLMALSTGPTSMGKDYAVRPVASMADSKFQPIQEVIKNEQMKKLFDIKKIQLNTQ